MVSGAVFSDYAQLRQNRYELMDSFAYLLYIVVFSALFFLAIFFIEHLIHSMPDDSSINIEKAHLRKLRRAGLTWNSPEELANKFFEDRYWWSVVNRAQRDNLASQIAQVLRWYTPKGKEATKAVHEAIQTTSKQFKELAEAAHRSGKALPFWYLPLDLHSITFEWQGEVHRVHDLQNLIITGSKTEGITNLVGIPFEGLNMHNVQIMRATFHLAQFKNCMLGNSKFDSCSFHGSTFKHCRLASLRFENSSLQGADLSTSHLNAMTFDDQNLPHAIRFLKISYLQLLRFICQCLWHKDERYFAKKTWTDFVWVDVNSLTRTETADFKNYVTWYKHSMASVRTIAIASLSETAFVIFQALTSKFWSSFRVFFSTIAVLILTFAGFFFIEKTGFGFDKGTPGIMPTFWDLAEFSFKTFTNAGFSDLKPTSPLARIAVILESVFGYISLAVLIFLLSRKMADR